MSRLSSDKVELGLVSYFFKPEFYMKCISINDEYFTKSQHKHLVNLIKLYVGEFQAPPTKKTLVSYADKFVLGDKDVDKYTDALLVLDKLPKTEPQEFNYFMSKANNYYVGRLIFDMAESIKSEFENKIDIDYNEMKKRLLRSLLIIDNERRIKRGFIYDDIKNRWGQFVNVSKGKVDDLIPFGIKTLDDKLGGMRRSFVTLMYSKTGGGKTRTSVNIAYNAALAGYNVMYLSLEMAFNFIASCFDSRMALVDGNGIIYGKLDRKDIKKFKHALKEQLREKLNVWLVDIPNKASTNDVYNEIELYKSVNGVYPDLVIIDYANLMTPNTSFRGRSEKYDFLFKEYHEIARYTNVSILTATMESRERSKSDKDKARHTTDEHEGVEGIGLSNYMAPHCEIVMRLRQTMAEMLQNKLFVVVDKHRYARAFEEIELYAVWPLNYVGDRLIPGTKGLIMKANNK